MAVYTKITKEELHKHLQSFDIGDLISFDEIIDGIDNSNFVVKTSQDKFILTIFESRIDKNFLPYFINLKEHLSQKNIPCPKPLKNNKGENISYLKNKQSTIVSFLSGSSLKASDDGYYRNITIHHCEEIGKYLAKMHLASQDFKSQKINDLNVFGIEKLFNNFRNLLQNYDKSLIDLIQTTINFVKDNWDNSMPSAPCHLDLFPDNVFFDNNNNISAIIDFYFSANDLLIYDLAIIINAWCFDIDIFNHNKFSALAKSYQSIRALSKKEIEFLPIALIFASLRFLTTRLNDYFYTPKDSLVKIKDPMEYKNKLLFFLNNRIKL